MLTQEYKNAFMEGFYAFHKNELFESCYYHPDSKHEYAYIKGWQYAKNQSLNESYKSLNEDFDDAEEFFLNYGWIKLTEAKGIYNGGEVTLDNPHSNPDDGKRKRVFVNSGQKVKHDGKERIKAKKITFGSDKGSDLRVSSDPEARKQFAARHGCSDANDKKSAKYWSCRQGGPGYW